VTKTTSLAEDLEAAHSAPASARIDHRDRLAAHGPAAIEALIPWLTDPTLCWFAVRVIWKAGQLGARDRAIRVLREALDDATVATSRDDVATHLRLLGVPVSAPAPKVTSSRPTSIPALAGTGWPGFREVEFATTDGTSWRGRTGKDSLIPHLVRPLRELDWRFESWPKYRLPEVHIAIKDRYRDPDDWAQGWRAAKLVTYADRRATGLPDEEQIVTVGLLVEKGNGQGDYGPVDRRWDWPFFIERLRDDPFRQQLTRVMGRHELTLGDYRAGSFQGSDAFVGFTGHVDGGDLIIEPGTSAGESGWPSLLERLERLPNSAWHNFHIWRSWPADVAIAAGPSFAGDVMVPVISDLARIYLTFVGGEGGQRLG
jgi:hypothetical protein